MRKVEMQHQQQASRDAPELSMGYQPIITQVNCEDIDQQETSAIFNNDILMNQNIVKPGRGKFVKDEEGYTQPQQTFDSQCVSQHLPTPIPSSLTFRGGEDQNMRSRESTQNDNSATLPMMDNASNDDWCSDESAASGRLNNIVIKKQRTCDDQQMNTANSEPMDTSMRHTNPSAQQISSENCELDGVALQKKTRENYQDSLPTLSKPIATIDDVPEEEFKLSPRPNIEHSTPQIKVAPLMERDAVEQIIVPSSTPLGPSRMTEEEKQRAKSMGTLANFGIRQKGDGNSSSKLMQRRKRPMNLKLSVSSVTSSRSGSVKQYSSEAEMLQLTLEENQARCDFFKHFQYNSKDKLGTGCSSDVYFCQPMPQDIQFVTVKSAHYSQSSNNSNNGSTQLVVKVCDTSDVNKAQAALNEANILKKIECDLINQLVAFYEDPQVNKSYLVLEFAGYHSLTQFIQNKKDERSANPDSDSHPGGQLLGEDLVRTILRQLLQATEYMHRRGICHRDLKPDNLMISQYTEPNINHENTSQLESNPVMWPARVPKTGSKQASSARV